MSEWRFSDGTVVHSNGEVYGNSDFAEYSSDELSRVAEGILVVVPLGPQPSREVPLKLGDDELMAAWLLSLTYAFQVRLLSGPRPKPPTIEYIHVEGRIY